MAEKTYIWKQKLYLSCLLLLLVYGVSYARAANIAVIKSASIKPYNQALSGFKSVNSAQITTYDLQQNTKQGENIVAAIKSQKPDIVYAIGTKAAVIAKENFKQLPIVFSMVSRPKKYGLDKPNIAGISINIPPETQFRILKTTFKKNLRLIGVIYNPENTNEKIKRAKQAADQLGLKLLPEAAHSYHDIPKVLREVLNNIEVLWLAMDEVILNKLTIKHIILSATRHKIPILGFSPRFIKDGVLLALKTNYFDMGAQAAELAIDMLNQKKPDAYKIIPPRKIIPVINVKVAKFLGLEIQPEILEQSELYK